MANTYQVIAANKLTALTSSVTFTGISQSYDHLCLLLNAQTNYNNFDDIIFVTFNSNASNYYRVGAQSGSSIAWTSSGVNSWCLCAGNTTTAQFGTSELWISRYSSSTLNKRTGAQACANGTSNATMQNMAGAWNNTSAITSITLTPQSGAFTAGSNFFLYGIADS